ncbi:MAG: hypothetical protein ACI9ES_003215 [Oceanospirillaceae bacterium]
MQSLDLICNKVIPATPSQVFEMWTDPDKFKCWWGPVGVNCSKVELDFKVGGSYSIENLFEDGGTLMITGVYEEIVEDKKLVYSWVVGNSDSIEKVTVLFDQHSDGTMLTVIHKKITSIDIQKKHAVGWRGCLDKLYLYSI